MPMKAESRKYEYIRIRFDSGDLTQLNRMSSAGWRVATSWQEAVGGIFFTYALLERELINYEESR